MNILKEAHKLTREIIKEFPNVDYKAQLGICISYLSRKEKVKMVELKGSEKQVAWAEDLRKNAISKIEDLKDAIVDKTVVKSEVIYWKKEIKEFKGWDIEESKKVSELRNAASEIALLAIEALKNEERADLIITWFKKYKGEFSELQTLIDFIKYPR